MWTIPHFCFLAAYAVYSVDSLGSFSQLPIAEHLAISVLSLLQIVLPCIALDINMYFPIFASIF